VIYAVYVVVPVSVNGHGTVLGYSKLQINKPEIRSMERGICPIAPLALHLTLYSLMVAEISSLKHFGVTTLTLLGHVTSSVT